MKQSALRALKVKIHLRVFSIMMAGDRSNTYEELKNAYLSLSLSIYIYI
jgi:hypothetical protein